MPEKWRTSVVKRFKNKGYLKNCSNYRDTKSMSHTMKI